MKIRIFLTLILSIVSIAVSANSLRIFTLSADDWARPRAGAVISEITAIRSAVSYWEKELDSVILIRYPGEDTGEIWATELRDWLVSLGIPSDYIMLASGNPAADEINLIVGNRAEIKQ